MIYKNDREKAREFGLSRPVGVTKESKCRKRKTFQMSWEGGGKETERTVAQKEGITKVKEVPEWHTAWRLVTHQHSDGWETQPAAFGEEA